MKSFPTYVRDGKCYSLPFPMNVGKSGKMQIEIYVEPAGARLPVVSMRNALFMGLRQTVLTLTEPLHIHRLKQNGYGVWMTTMPQEVEQHIRQLKGFHGTVLVGGLGLGVAVAILEKMPKVKKIIVVEKSKDVINLVWPYLPKRKTSIVNDDLYHYLEEAKANSCHCDCAFYDIWCPTGEAVLVEHTMPLRRLSEGVVTSRIECWNEDEMIGQVRMECMTGTLMMDAENKSWPHPINCDEATFKKIQRRLDLTWYFHRWVRTQKPTKEQAVAMVEVFCETIKMPRLFDERWVKGGAS